ncbi:ABC transporter permease subunit [Ruegeria denitrificans]|uniref:ABC transporter permease subunit n=1 Tax=Ruegeria denitrificans TaxID=1715692 RepID=UPI003C7A3B34
MASILATDAIHRRDRLIFGSLSTSSAAIESAPNILSQAPSPSSGLSTTRLKAFAFLTSAFIAGLGGAFYVHYLGSLAPRALFDINFLFTIIVAALLGGTSTIIGPMIGAFFMTFLLEYLRPVLPGAERYFVYGAIALLLYMYQPKGLVELAQRGFQRLRKGGLT